MHNIQTDNESNSMIAFSLNSSCYSSFSSHFVYIVVLNARKLLKLGCHVQFPFQLHGNSSVRKEPQIFTFLIVKMGN